MISRAAAVCLSGWVTRLVSGWLHQRSLNVSCVLVNCMQLWLKSLEAGDFAGCFGNVFKNKKWCHTLQSCRRFVYVQINHWQRWSRATAKLQNVCKEKKHFSHILAKPTQGMCWVSVHWTPNLSFLSVSCPLCTKPTRWGERRGETCWPSSASARTATKAIRSRSPRQRFTEKGVTLSPRRPQGLCMHRLHTQGDITLPIVHCIFCSSAAFCFVTFLGSYADSQRLWSP